MPVFEYDLNDQKQNDRFIMGARNWCAVKRDATTGDLEFELRIEKEKGSGITKSYPVKSPPPAWQVSKEHFSALHTKGFGKLVEPIKHHEEKKHGATVGTGANGSAPTAAPTTAAAA